jgi:hypothetical protein
MALLVMQDIFGNVPTWPLCKRRSHVMCGAPFLLMSCCGGNTFVLAYLISLTCLFFPSIISKYPKSGRFVLHVPNNKVPRHLCI